MSATCLPLSPASHQIKCRGQAGGPAEGRIVRLLSLVRKCIMGVWHPPVQFRSKSDRAQAPQSQAICTISFCGHNNRALKCPVRAHSAASACLPGRRYLVCLRTVCPTVGDRQLQLP